MKILNKKLVLVFALIISVQLLDAQQATATNQPGSKWSSTKGFWVIESNVKTPRSSIVRFYTDSQQLIYAERVEGFEINVNKRKTLKKLKTALDQAMYSWEKNGHVVSQGELLATLVRKTK